MGGGCAWGRSNLATARSTEEQMAEGRGGIDANGGRGLGSAEEAPLPLNQGEFCAFTPVLVDFGVFFISSGRVRRQTRRGTRDRSDQMPAQQKTDQTRREAGQIRRSQMAAWTDQTDGRPSFVGRSSPHYIHAMLQPAMHSPPPPTSPERPPTTPTGHAQHAAAASSCR